jgi:hypothetical protein
MPWQDAANQWWWFATDPAVTTDKWIYNGPFVIGNTAIIYADIEIDLESPADGLVIELSYNGGSTWVDVTQAGGTLSPPYNTSIIAGPFTGRSAYSGTMGPVTVTIDLRAATPGSALLRFRVGVNNVISRWGAAVTNIKDWDDGLTPPTCGSGWSDNSCVYLSWDTGTDPRVTGSQIRGSIDGGNTWLSPNWTPYTPPIQLTGLLNGTSYIYQIVNVDGYGNQSAPITIGPLTPICTGYPPEALITMTIDKSQNPAQITMKWAPQTAEVPCDGTDPYYTTEFVPSWGGLFSVWYAPVSHDSWGLLASPWYDTTLTFYAIYDDERFFFVRTKKTVWSPGPP